MHTDWHNRMVFGYGLWPDKEMEVIADGSAMILSPLSCDTQASIHIDLYSQMLSIEQSEALMNKFLSHLCWVSDQPLWLADWGFAVNSGLPQKTFQREQSRLFESPGTIPFPDHFELINDTTALKLIALYREGKVAQNYSIPYACLSFYRVLEYEKKASRTDELSNWMDSIISQWSSSGDLEDGRVFQEVEKYKNEYELESVSDVLYKVVRCSAAHYPELYDLNPDQERAKEIYKHAQYLLQKLARKFISDEKDISDSIFSIGYYKNSRYACKQ